MKYRARNSTGLIHLDNKILYRSEVNIIHFERSIEGANEADHYAVLDEIRGYIFLHVRIKIQPDNCFWFLLLPGYTSAYTFHKRGIVRLVFLHCDGVCTL